jgi:hypothetical protein
MATSARILQMQVLAFAKQQMLGWSCDLRESSLTSVTKIGSRSSQVWQVWQK